MKDSRRRWRLWLSRNLRSIRAAGLQRLLLGAGYGAAILTTAFVMWLIAFRLLEGM